MTYRNDHDAALHRVDALEGELARLRKEYDQKPREPVRDAPNKPLIGSGWLGTIIVVAAVMAIWLARGDGSAEPARIPQAPVVAPVKPIAPVAGEPDWLRPCVNAIEKLPMRLDASNTDPRGVERAPVESIAVTGAGCRDALGMFAKHSDDRLFRAWSAAEGQLAGAITRILVYYRFDPYALDNYATAARLWIEYDAAIVTRDQALRDLR